MPLIDQQYNFRNLIWFIVLGLVIGASVQAAEPPSVLRDAIGFAPLACPDGAVEHYYTIGDQGLQSVVRIRSEDGGDTWSQPENVMDLPAESLWYSHTPHPMFDRDGTLHLFVLDMTKVGMSWWHTKRPIGGRWTELREVGPCSPQTTPIQLRSGRILVPIGYLLPNRAWDATTGCWETTAWYSDDAGDTWERSSDTLVVNMPNDYPDRHTGGFEPVVVELPDGRVWMLVRTQNGWLYESFSSDGGTHWSPLQPSDFRSSDSPASLTRLSNGAVVIVWNNCDSPAPIDGQWIYTGRDALHAAISDDGGLTWRGFREVYLDPLRNETPPRSGDRGTAYPCAVAAPDDTLYLVSGQGEQRTKLFHIDPGWLRETQAVDDFSHGLSGWSVFKGYGPVESFRRPRIAGAELVPHPQNADARVLHIRRPDDRDGDGAAWNFPAGKVGSVTVRLMLAKGFGGGLITLADRFIYPQDTDHSKVAFALSIASDGTVGSKRLVPEEWYTIELSWATEQQPPGGGWHGECIVSVDGERVLELPQLHRAKQGLSYLRLHSTSRGIDLNGLLVETVSAQVQP